jgi:hypothetical protein
MQRLPVTLIAALGCLFSQAAAAQRIECVNPPEPASINQRCTYEAPTTASEQTLVVRVQGGTLTDTVRFTLTSAGGSVTQNVAVNSAGLAQFRWHGAAGGTGAVIAAETTIKGQTLRREIEVKAAPITSSRRLQLLSPSTAYWYEERQLRAPIEVRIDNPGDQCESNVVVFRTVATLGSASPDTVRAGVDNDHPGSCVARTWWRLGKGVGRQHLRAFLTNEPTRGITTNAIARALPRIGGGIAATRDLRDYEVLESTSATVKVTRRIPKPEGGDSTVVVDSIVRTNKISTVEGNWLTEPTINVDFPVIARVTGLRGVLGVSLKNPGRDWFVGVSALQPIFGVTHENLGVDLNAVMHFGRRQIVRDLACRDDDNGDSVPDLGDCKVKDKLFFPMGFGFSATIDASQLTLLGNIFK